MGRQLRTGMHECPFRVLGRCVAQPPSLNRPGVSGEFPAGYASIGEENRDSGIHTASVAARYAGIRSTLSGVVARTANSRHGHAPIRRCWIPTAFALMTDALRVTHIQSRELHLSPRTLRPG